MVSNYSKATVVWMHAVASLTKPSVRWEEVTNLQKTGLIQGWKEARFLPQRKSAEIRQKKTEPKTGLDPDKVLTTYFVPVFGKGKGSCSVRIARSYVGSSTLVRDQREDELRRKYGMLLVNRDEEKDRSIASTFFGPNGERKALDAVIRWKESVLKQPYSSRNLPPLMVSQRKSSTCMKGLSMIKIGREVGVTQIEGSKLLVGLYPRRIPPSIIEKCGKKRCGEN